MQTFLNAMSVPFCFDDRSAVCTPCFYCARFAGSQRPDAADCGSRSCSYKQETRALGAEDRGQSREPEGCLGNRAAAGGEILRAGSGRIASICSDLQDRSAELEAGQALSHVIDLSFMYCDTGCAV